MDTQVIEVGNDGSIGIYSVADGIEIHTVEGDGSTDLVLTRELAAALIARLAAALAE